MRPTKNNVSQGKSGILTDTAPLTTENREIAGFLWPATGFAMSSRQPLNSLQSISQDRKTASRRVQSIKSTLARSWFERIYDIF